MTTWVVLDVGCLECHEWSEVLCATTDEREAREVFDKARWARYGEDSPVMVEQDTLARGPASLVDADGNGGSYFYPIQLHKVES